MRRNVAIVFLVVTVVGTSLGVEISYPSFPRPVGLNERIIGGSDSAPGQFPYQVSLQTELSGRRTHNCGGAVLNAGWVVTAAHCVANPPTLGHFLVVAGEHDLDVEEGTEQESRVETIFIHPLFPLEPVISANDIALIKLSTPLVLNARVQPVSLPEPDSVPSGSSVLSGWGSTGTGILFPIMPSVLQTSPLPIVEHADCLGVYPGTPLDETNVCTGPLEGGTGACSGDSGGPLVQAREDGSLELIGLVSWSRSPCAGKNNPTVYTRVSAFIDFIDQHVNN